MRQVSRPGKRAFFTLKDGRFFFYSDFGAVFVVKYIVRALICLGNH